MSPSRMPSISWPRIFFCVHSFEQKLQLLLGDEGPREKCQTLSSLLGAFAKMLTLNRLIYVAANILLDDGYNGTNALLFSIARL